MGSATVSLIMGGSDLNPDAVTVALGVAPSNAHRACDPDLRRRYGDAIWRTGMWTLTRRDVAIDDIANVVEELAERFRSRKSALKDLGIQRQIVSIGLFELRGLGETFYLETPIMLRLAELGLTLMIDAYGSSPAAEQSLVGDK